jgi:prepilin peptidase CpaA
MAAIGLFYISIILLYAALSDLRSLTIPNQVPVFIIGVFAVALLWAPDSFAPISAHFFSALILFIVTFFMFVFNVMGAGDSKLLAALGFWIPLNELPEFILWMTVSGALLGIFALYIKKSGHLKSQTMQSRWIADLHEGKSAVPYGVAIAIGFFAVTL